MPAVPTKIVADAQKLITDSRETAEMQRMCRSLLASGLFEKTERVAAIEAQMAELFAPLTNIVGRHGESRSCALFDYGLNGGLFDKGLHPGVISSRKEFQLPVGRVDRLLTHQNGSFTVVEIKPSGSRRDQAQGLGQAIMYASSMRAALRDNRDVRAALFVSSDFDPEIADACKSVGVEYLSFSLASQKLVDELAEIHGVP